MDPEEKARIREQRLAERFAFEEKRKGGFELIYPWPGAERNEVYNNFIQKANDLWDEFTTGTKSKKIGANGCIDDKRQQNNSSFNRQAQSKHSISTNTFNKGASQAQMQRN